MTAIMNEKTCLVTGGTSGIGYEIALGLARQGARVAIVGRNRDKGAAAARAITDRGGNPRVEFLPADLTSQASVRELAATVTARYDRLDVLINNAGSLFMKRLVTVDGIEMTFALDHLAYFLLTNLLLPMLRDSAPARIVNTSSGAHSRGRIHFDDLQGERKYGGWRAYSQAKLANILFTYELSRRLEGSGVTANCFHPGFVATDFAQNNGGLMALMVRLGHPFAVKVDEGAKTGVYLASSQAVEHTTGQYFVKEKPRKSNARSYDPAVAARLWEVSAKLTGLGA
ncbi:MAG TPA: SDR family oxidoreductase [Chloroflexota bacterium]